MALPPLRDQRLLKAFAAAALTREGESIKQPEQWRTFDEITKRAEKARETATRLHEQNYNRRVRLEEHRLMKKATHIERTLKPPVASSDKLSPARLRIDAEKNVRLRHEMRHMRIDGAEEAMKFRLLHPPPDPSHTPARRRGR